MTRQLNNSNNKKNAAAAAEDVLLLFFSSSNIPQPNENNLKTQENKSDHRFDIMKVITRSIFAVSVLWPFFDSRRPFLGVDGALMTELGVTCHPESKNLCYGIKTVWTPSPAVICPDPPSDETCATTYVGGWGWSYEFVHSLEEGITDPDIINNSMTGFTIKVTLDDDETTCVVNAKLDCDFCSAEGCDGFGQIKYDCTNIHAGLSSLDECVALDEDFFFPFDVKSFDNLGTKDGVDLVDEVVSEKEAPEAGSSIVGGFGSIFLFTTVGAATTLLTLLAAPLV